MATNSSPSVAQNDLVIQEQEQATEKIIKRAMLLAQTILTVASAILIIAFSSYKDVEAHRHVLVGGGCFLIMTFLSSLLLVFFKVFLSERTLLQPWHNRVLQILCVTSGAMLLAANSMFQILVRKENGALALCLVPAHGILAALAYHGLPTDASARDEVFQAKMKSSGKLCLLATAASYAVQTPVIFGYLKNSSFKELNHRMDLSVSFLASALSVCSAVVTCMPLGFRAGDASSRDKVLSMVRYLKGAVVAALAVTAVTLAHEFLGGNVVLSLLPEIIVATVYHAMDLCSDELAAPATAAGQDHRRERDPVQDKKIELLPIVVVVTFGFGMLGAAYAALLGTADYDAFVKALVFSLLAAVMSSLCRVAMPLGYSQRGKISLGNVAWLGLVCNILPVIEMLVAIPLGTKALISSIPVS